MPYSPNTNSSPLKNAAPAVASQQNTAVARPDFAGGNDGGLNQSLNTLLASNEMMAREIATVQAQVFMAKTFPRDVQQCLSKIEASCNRESLAEIAIYRYGRGGTDISGPSINLLREISQSWGNLESGFKVLERNMAQHYSKIIAYAIDYETNVRKAREFTVAHRRDTKSGSYLVTDERDIYELEANAASRRERACLESIIPKDVIDWAVLICEKTMTRKYKKGMDIEKLEKTFRSEFGVTRAQIEAYIGRKLEAMDTFLYSKLQGVYRSLRDGVGSVDDFFKEEVEEAPAKPAAKSSSKAKATAKEAVKEEAPAPKQEEPAKADEIPFTGIPLDETKKPDSAALSKEEMDEYDRLLAEEFGDELEDEGDY